MTIATEAASYIARTSVSAGPMCMFNNVIKFMLVDIHYVYS